MEFFNCTWINGVEFCSTDKEWGCNYKERAQEKSAFAQHEESREGIFRINPEENAMHKKCREFSSQEARLAYLNLY